MIGLYTQNKNTTQNLCQLFQEQGLEIYTPKHTYDFVLWLSNEQPPKLSCPIFLLNQVNFPMSYNQWISFLQKTHPNDLSYQNDFFIFDATQRQLLYRITNQVIPLTEKENELLLFLARAPQHTATKEELLHAVWQYNPSVETHTLESHLYALRQKIGKDANNLIQMQEGVFFLL